MELGPSPGNTEYEIQISESWRRERGNEAMSLTNNQPSMPTRNPLSGTPPIFLPQHAIPTTTPSAPHIRFPQPLPSISCSKHFSLPDWIQSARLCLTKKDYLECAIALASELTQSLVRVIEVDANDAQLSWNDSLTNMTPEDIGGATSSLLLVKIEDIVPNNVLVECSASANTNNIHGPAASSANNFKATKVTVQPGTKDSKLRDIFEAPLLSQRDVCFALGKILFELFSEGASSMFLTESDLQTNKESDFGNLQIGGNSNENDNSASSLNMPSVSTSGEGIGQENEQNDHMDDITFPALKRAFLSSTAETTSQMKSVKANEYLQSLQLPLSVCQLVSDLLDAEEGNPYMPDTALSTLEDAQHDLGCMKRYPGRFLYDHLCPRRAMEKTNLFSNMEGELYGRENELGVLMDMVARVSLHVPLSPQREDFLCEAAFISGHSGSGKSSIIKRLVSYSNANDWSLVFCKFDRQISPLSTLVTAFDFFFGKFVPKIVSGMVLEREPHVQETFDRMCHSIITSIDSEIFGQLCELLPRFGQLFPESMQYVQKSKLQSGAVAHENNSLSSFVVESTQDTNASSTGNVGSGKNRLLNLFRILIKIVCGAGHPFLMCVEDLHWADELTMDIITQVAGKSSISENEHPRGRMILLGSFRDDEVPEEGFLMNKIKLLEQCKVTRIFVGELPVQDINKLLSFKFCLPMRHTRCLAELVYQKTRGHPIFVIEFLRSIIQRNLMTFSVKARRWTWDDTTIDLQMISEGVVGLLTKKLKELPHDLIEALKVASCFGQVNVLTIELLSFVPNMLESLESAGKEGIVEKAGPIFAFSHDMLQESTYNLIPPGERKPLHKKIGVSLVLQDSQVAENADLCTLAVNQINICIGDGILDQTECALFARLNLAAGKHSMSTKNYDQARGYFEAGITLLHAEHWSKQYALSLELYHLSVVVSFMDGKVEAVASRLDYIMSNSRSFNDTINSRVLLAKFLASQAQYTEAIRGVLDILSNLGESFPQVITTSLVMNEINAVMPMLKGISVASLKNLPTMTDRTKLQVMKFLDLLTSISNFSSPMLMHLVSCRLVKLTFAFGYCEGCSISGLVFISHGLLHYHSKNDSYDSISQASQICRVAESLIKENPNSHSLRAQLTLWISCVMLFVEPCQAIIERLVDGYTSATIVGDVDNAIICGLSFTGGAIFCTADLKESQKKNRTFLSQMAKHKRIGALYSSMSYFDAYTTLIGKENVGGVDAGIEMKTNKQLYQAAVQTQNSYLVHQVTLNQMYVHCYFREYLPCANLAEKYQTVRDAKRTFDFLLVFYSGIAALSLARDTKQEKWRKIGEEANKSMMQLVQHSTWNFENKSQLLQAELHYVNGHTTMAELAYQSSIASAHDHKFIHEEALACELFAIYLVENKKVKRGLRQLQIAHDKYKQWGALKKADAVKEFMEMVNSAWGIW